LQHGNELKNWQKVYEKLYGIYLIEMLMRSENLWYNFDLYELEFDYEFQFERKQ